MNKVYPSLKLEQELWAQGISPVAGVDEAGRGPLAGPVVAAAVIFPEGIFIDGVADSKILSAKRREELFPLIQQHASAIGIGVVDHATIDEVNIYQATIRAMREALENLSHSPAYVLVDGNSFTHETLRFQNIIKGDMYSFTIAAASIIAKVTRDKLMNDYDARFPEYGFAQHKGYGTQKHLEAIKKFGFCDIHRRSFHPAALDESTI